jgi:hypothetical protein
MADVFGNTDLFGEFEKERKACDKIVKSSCLSSDEREIRHKHEATSLGASRTVLTCSDGIRREGTAKNDLITEECRRENSSHDYINKLEAEVERLKTLNILCKSVSRCF